MKRVISALILLSIGMVWHAPSLLSEPYRYRDRLESIPDHQAKVHVEDDVAPPKVVSDEYQKPAPLPFPINTAGAEDSAYIMPDGKTLYFWFTPEATFDLQKQLRDGATGIYVSHRQGEQWSVPERVILNAPGQYGLDGCAFVQDHTMWFCTTREDMAGMHWYKAEFKEGKWRNWIRSDFRKEWQVGELHITDDGTELYFGSYRGNKKNNMDIWVSRKLDDVWQEPTKVDAVNSTFTEGWPFVTHDGKEMWFTRQMGSNSLWRSKRVGGVWQKPEEMIRVLAGEPSVDNEGNVYFTHHYYKNHKLLEADIYVARKKTSSR